MGLFQSLHMTTYLTVGSNSLRGGYEDNILFSEGLVLVLFFPLILQ